jgi:hypothetical protein
MRNVLSLSALLATLALSGPAGAQAPPPPAPPVHHSILSHIFHRPDRPGTPPPSMRPVRPGMPSSRVAPITGGIIGNKNSHVYHLPGDKGSLPAVQNRIYFRTEAQAVAAGYHKSGSGTPKTHPMTGVHPKPLIHTH